MFGLRKLKKVRVYYIKIIQINTSALKDLIKSGIKNVGECVSDFRKNKIKPFLLKLFW